MILILIVVAAAILVIFVAGREGFCPNNCSPFQYPDMYNPRGICSDRSRWGADFYTTGPCPKKIGPAW